MKRREPFRRQPSIWWVPIGMAMSVHAVGVRAQTAAPSPAASASAPEASTARLESVTITAQKRREKAQDVPTAISVITERDIERAGINNIQDAAALTPNLVVIDQLRPGIQTVSFRGFTTVQGGQSPFAIVVDGVSQPGQEFLKQSFVDVQQIEVLRGPQGTLYGAGAIAGAINIVTKPPSDRLEGKVGFGFGEGGEQSYNASISAPLSSDVAWARLGVAHRDFKGLISNDSGGNADSSHETTYTGQVLLKPTSALSVDLRANGTKGHNSALWLVLVTNDQFDDFSKNPSTDINGRDKRDLRTYSAKVDYALEPFTITSISSYNQADQFLFADGDFSPTPLFGQTWRNDTRALAQELRLTSNGDGPLRWNVGTFWQRYSVHDVTQFGALPADGNVLGLTGGNVTDTKNYSQALFGQASYAFDAFEVTGGLRYDRVRAAVNDPNTGFADNHVFKELQPKVSLAWKMTSDQQAYVTWSKGFRTGGFNPNTPLTARLYQNETSNNLELGMKSAWLNDSLIFNAALFHTKFKDQQFFYSLATSSGIFRAITNIPETTVNGAELELQYRPLSWFKLNGSIGYNDSQIERFDTGQFNGNRVPQVYGFTSNLGLEAQQAVGNGGLLVGRIDWNHRGEVYWDLANELRTPPKNFFNARIAYSASLGSYDWQVALWAKNLTDERTPAAVGANAFGPGNTLRSANQPRQVGVDFQVRF